MPNDLSTKEQHDAASNGFARLKANRKSKPQPAFDSLQQFDQLPDSATVPVAVAAKLRGTTDRSVWRDLAEGRLTRIKLGTRTTRVMVGELRKQLRGEAQS